MNWENKLNLLFIITSDLNAIHSQKIIHRDLHSGNILQDNLHSAYIVDLGLSIQYLKQDRQIYGVLPYVDPKVLMGSQYTLASDVYSFGMIMWEILYGKSVSYNCDLSDNNFQIKVCYENLRPLVNDEAPRCYVDLMKRCWDQDPENRPTAQELCDIFREWQYDEKILSELNEYKVILENVGNSYIDIYGGASKIIPQTNSISISDSGLLDLDLLDLEI
ncbi:kinase-like domain-containing protein [Gigaspora rosea]|uniref:Kinase-like domain-containing protein n=1 Tax=Gigaspora rosea TaxID=44941 RepID=A0A397VHJ5_9GLOM|nr:kinase-like domain-containing protein [Gigaspora rosea]